MDFELSEEQRDIQKAAREFARGEFDNDQITELELRMEFPREIWKKACRLGFIGIHIPEAYGGQGAGVLENALVTEEFCRKDSRIGSALSFSDYGLEILWRHGTEEQKKKYLGPVVKGEYLSTLAQEEPEENRSQVLKEGGRYVLNGVKRLVLNGKEAGYYLFFCQGQGSLMILLESGGEEIAFVPQDKMGMRMISTGELRLNNVSVPVDRLIGREGEGSSLLESFLSESEVEISAQGLGMAEGALERGLDYAKQRVQFGRSLNQFQVIRHRLADMATHIEMARLLIHKAAWLTDENRMDAKLCAMARACSGELVVDVVDAVLQIFGGYGYMTETEIEHFYRDAWWIDIFGGKNNLKDRIARRVIG